MKEETEEMDVDKEDAGPQFSLFKRIKLCNCFSDVSMPNFLSYLQIVKKWSGQQMVENTEQSLGTLRLIAAANVAPVAYPVILVLMGTFIKHYFDGGTLSNQFVDCCSM
uniref:Uncharacterized protein n=1 Tax=Ditylenchus dipsaci TaxID=166011 RepID=A0A915EP34_9BILA